MKAYFEILRLPGRYIDFSSLREIPEYEEAAEAAETVRTKKLLKRLRPEDF